MSVLLTVNALLAEMGKPPGTSTATGSSSAASSKIDKKKSKKRERVEEEEEVYVVEKILDKRVLEDGTVLYYLKWRVCSHLCYILNCVKASCCTGFRT